jgi:acetyl esterase/lipase
MYLFIPQALVDLKAGIRFIKANAGNLPGNTKRIISIGSSAAAL